MQVNISHLNPYCSVIYPRLKNKLYTTDKSYLKINSFYLVYDNIFKLDRSIQHFN